MAVLLVIKGERQADLCCEFFPFITLLWIRFVEFLDWDLFFCYWLGWCIWFYLILLLDLSCLWGGWIPAQFPIKIILLIFISLSKVELFSLANSKQNTIFRASNVTTKRTFPDYYPIFCNLYNENNKLTHICYEPGTPVRCPRQGYSQFAARGTLSILYHQYLRPDIEEVDRNKFKNYFTTFYKNILNL